MTPRYDSSDGGMSRKSVRQLINSIKEEDATPEQLQELIEAYKYLSIHGDEIDAGQTKKEIQRLLDSQDVMGRLKRKTGEAGRQGRWQDYTGPGTIEKGYTEMYRKMGLGGNEGGETINEAQAGYRPMLEDILTEFIVTNRRMPEVGELRDFANQKGMPGQDFIAEDSLPNFLNNQDNKNFIAQNLGGQTKDYSGDISRLSQQLKTQQFSATRKKDVDDYLTQLPDDLKRTRDEFMSGNIERAKADFEDYIPNAASELNRRGIMFGGGLDDLLTQKASNLAGGLDELQLQLENEDNQFYFNAAYQNALKTELSARDDYREALNSERSRISTERSNRFQSAQSNYDRTLNEELSRSDLNRQYEANKTRMNNQRNANKNSARSKLFSNVGSSAGAIVGASVGGPPGAIVGSQIGSIPGELG